MRKKRFFLLFAVQNFWQLHKGYVGKVEQLEFRGSIAKQHLETNERNKKGEIQNCQKILRPLSSVQIKSATKV